MDSALSIIQKMNLIQMKESITSMVKFQEMISEQLREGTDYGKIPGTPSLTLLKPGAEKIILLMQLTSEIEIESKIEDFERGLFSYTVRCILSTISGQRITEALGSANSKEARYDVRWVTEKKIPEGLDKLTLEKQKRNGQYGEYFVYKIENDDPFTLCNTILKMAEKRATVGAALKVGGLSDVFTQDMEDLKGQEKTSAKPTNNQNKHWGQYNDGPDNSPYGGSASDESMASDIEAERPRMSKDYWCSECGVRIQENVAQYSKRNFGSELCRDCQEDRKKRKNQPQPQAANQTQPQPPIDDKALQKAEERKRIVQEICSLYSLDNEGYRNVRAILDSRLAYSRDRDYKKMTDEEFDRFKTLFEVVAQELVAPEFEDYREDFDNDGYQAMRDKENQEDTGNA